MEMRYVQVRSHAVSHERMQRERKRRAQARRKQALDNIIATVMAWFHALPQRTYALTVDLMQKTIILCLLFGCLLFAFCFFLAAGMWFCKFIPGLG